MERKGLSSKTIIMWPSILQGKGIRCETGFTRILSAGPMSTNYSDDSCLSSFEQEIGRIAQGKSTYRVSYGIFRPCLIQFLMEFISDQRPDKIARSDEAIIILAFKVCLLPHHAARPIYIYMNIISDLILLRI